MNPLEQFIATAPPIDEFRDEAERCAEETARWLRKERGPLRNPLDHGDSAEFSPTKRRRAKTCSKSCAYKLRWRNRKCPPIAAAVVRAQLEAA